jgi:hypothetical protein
MPESADTTLANIELPLFYTKQDLKVVSAGLSNLGLICIKQTRSINSYVSVLGRV